MTAEDIIAVAESLSVLAAALAGLWGIFSYRQSLRLQATRWTTDLFKGFYSDPAMDSARNLLEYEYPARMIPLLEMRVLDRTVQLSHRQREDLASLDLLLNYLEQLIYLEDRRVIGKGDKEVFFSYWFGSLLKPENSGLRRYLARCGYERIARHAGLSEAEHVLFYGTLMNNSPRQRQLQVDDGLRLVGTARLTGTMYELPTCPGVIPVGNDSHVVEVYRVLDEAALPILDDFEEFYAGEEDESRFLRRSVWVPELGLDAWVYYLNPLALPADSPTVPDDSWADFVRRTGKVLPADAPPTTYRHEYGSGGGPAS